MGRHKPLAPALRTGTGKETAQKKEKGIESKIVGEIGTRHETGVPRGIDTVEDTMTGVRLRITSVFQRARIRKAVEGACPMVTKRNTEIGRARGR